MRCYGCHSRVLLAGPWLSLNYFLVFVFDFDWVGGPAYGKAIPCSLKRTRPRSPEAAGFQ